MPGIGLSEAAKLTSRSQIDNSPAMKTGRLSFAVGDDGERRIDAAELDRVFGIKVNGAGPRRNCTTRAKQCYASV